MGIKKRMHHGGTESTEKKADQATDLHRSNTDYFFPNP